MTLTTSSTAISTSDASSASPDSVARPRGPSVASTTSIVPSSASLNDVVIPEFTKTAKEIEEATVQDVALWNHQMRQDLVKYDLFITTSKQATTEFEEKIQKMQQLEKVQKARLASLKSCRNSVNVTQMALNNVNDGLQLLCDTNFANEHDVINKLNNLALMVEEIQQRKRKEKTEEEQRGPESTLDVDDHNDLERFLLHMAEELEDTAITTKSCTKIALGTEEDEDDDGSGDVVIAGCAAGGEQKEVETKQNEKGRGGKDIMNVD